MVYHCLDYSGNIEQRGRNKIISTSLHRDIKHDSDVVRCGGRTMRAAELLFIYFTKYFILFLVVTVASLSYRCYKLLELTEVKEVKEVREVTEVKSLEIQPHHKALFLYFLYS